MIHAACGEGASASKRSMCMKWSEENHYEIGKYASIKSPAATVRKFRQRFSALNESTARTFRSIVETDVERHITKKSCCKI